jgi:hypothetical protein
MLTKELEKIVALLETLRVYPVDMEFDLNKIIREKLSAGGIEFTTEAKLGPRNRIDLLSKAGAGVAIKKGKPQRKQVFKQVERYCRSPKVKALVLVVERNLRYHPEGDVNGKLVRYVALRPVS